MFVKELNTFRMYPAKLAEFVAEEKLYRTVRIPWNNNPAETYVCYDDIAKLKA